MVFPMTRDGIKCVLIQPPTTALHKKYNRSNESCKSQQKLVISSWTTLRLPRRRAHPIFLSVAGFFLQSLALAIATAAKENLLPL